MNRWMNNLMACSLLMVGCADTVQEPVGEPIVLTTPDPATAERPADHYVAPHLVDLKAPAAVYCSEYTLIGAPNLTNGDVGEPVMTEHIGADGCVDERWIREWDGAQPLSEHYDFFDMALTQNVYVEPFAYQHTWTYDADGRVIKEQRDSLENDPNHGVWVQDTEYDSAGRMTRQRVNGSPLQPVIDWEHEDVWTYGPHSDEFETHTTISNGAVYTIVRQVFRPDGQLEEKYVTNVHAGRPEQLVLRRDFDNAGNVVLQESWEPATGNENKRTTFSYRADGTLQEEISHDLRYGRIDTTTYDEAERQLVYTQDSDEDGIVDYRKENRYDAAGNMVFTSTEYDFHRPQTRYSQVTWTYDAQNRVVEQVSTPQWMDGQSRRMTYDYDAHGAGYLLTLDLLDEQGTFVHTERITRHITPERTAWERVDGDRDGVLDSLTIRRWAGDRPLETIVDHDNDGIVDSIEQWHYDAAGQLTQHLKDHDADTIIDSVVLHAR